jgi:hypothetical protein
MLSRRRFLGHTAFGSLSAAALASLPAAAAGAIPQATAGYQDQPHEGQRCELCTHFVKPNSCKLVAGTINPQGWCKLFAANAQ